MQTLFGNTIKLTEAELGRVHTHIHTYIYTYISLILVLTSFATHLNNFDTS
jgi:hypothetical protein